jgi:hypothetical protein
MQTAFWKMHGLCVGVFADLKGLHAIKKGTGGVFVVGVVVGHKTGGAGRVPLFAAGDTGVAANADI